MKVFLPYRSEFGWKVMAHAPWVAAHDGPKIACIEQGEEALYPGCHHYHVEPREDYERRQWVERDYCDHVHQWIIEQHGSDVQIHYPPEHPEATLRGDLPARRFVPEPHVRLPFPAHPFAKTENTIALCPRWRRYGPEKNWPYWPWLANEIDQAGIKPIALGARETSVDCGVESAWHWPRALDATLEGMLDAGLVIATDNGLAHLAVLCGRPLLLISHSEGLVAPGTRNGCGKPWWPIKLERYHAANHQGAPIRVVHHGWDDPQRVLDAAREMMEGQQCTSSAPA